MSRIAKQPINLPKGVEVSLSKEAITVKGAKGTLTQKLHAFVTLTQEEAVLHVKPANQEAFANTMAGTIRALVSNMVTGVSQGFERKLQLVGVGYRAEAKGDKLHLTLGFSHPVIIGVPQGLEVKTPTQTEILINGADKQQVGQFSANVRAWRPPEPYKGKGIRYSDEHVVRKETKKK